jgi:hypothetical protein
MNDPSPEELAAIVAAIEMAWPRAVVVERRQPQDMTQWRFSGRWWSKPSTVQLQRPWVERRS